MADKLTIALDYDDTFTADPEFWREVIEVGRKYGHRVVCVTMRAPTEENRREIREGTGLLPICCDHIWKQEVCEKAGINIDIWIDDHPEWVRKPEE